MEDMMDYNDRQAIEDLFRKLAEVVDGEYQSYISLCPAISVLRLMPDNFQQAIRHHPVASGGKLL